MNTAAAFKPLKPRDADTPKGAVSELFAQVGGLKMVQVRLQISKTLAYAFTDPLADQEISFARVVALTSPTAPAAAEFLAFMAGGIFHPVPSNADCDRLELADVADQMKDHGAAVAAILHAVADGEVTAKEREQALPHIDAALRGLVRLRACMIAAADQV